jgi:hypothetical protein
MPRDARLTSFVVDEIVDAIDDARREIHAALGTRPWRTFIAIRRWSGPERGIGTATMEYREIDPPPEVTVDGGDRLGHAGRESTRSIKVRKISRRYTELELQPRADAKTEVAYLFRDRDAPNPPFPVDSAHRADMWGVLSARPDERIGDRAGDESDWRLSLKETTPMSPYDGVDEP